MVQCLHQAPLRDTTTRLMAPGCRGRRLKIKELQDTDPARCSMCAKFWRMHSRKGSTGVSDFLEAGNWNCVGQTDQLARFTARFTKPFETDQIGNVESLGLTLKLHWSLIRSAAKMFRNCDGVYFGCMMPCRRRREKAVQATEASKDDSSSTNSSDYDQKGIHNKYTI